MLTNTLRKLYGRDLAQLKKELELYSDEANIWRTSQQVSNSAGNLALHLVGNLNAYIGAEFGKTGFVRNRPGEFSLKNVPRAELVSSIAQTIKTVDRALASLTEAQLANEYPQEVSVGKVSTEFFLLHLAMHLSYHLGQVNYHRRLLDNAQQ